MINKLIKGRGNCHHPLKSVEMRFEAWDNVSEDGVIFGNLNNELAMFGAQLSKLCFEVLGMSVGDEELGCTRGELFHGLFEHCHVERNKTGK